MSFQKTLLITGGAGFIGSHLIRRLIHRYPEYLIVNVDSLTYAGNLENLRDIENQPNYRFSRTDITDAQAIEALFAQFTPEAVIHLAAESHVDRSIASPMDFVLTNVVGTVNLLNAARTHWKGRSDVLFYHVSTDEVFGSLGAEGYFREDTPYDPRSPYSASKASSDHFVRAYSHTYGIPAIISNCSNNYGPYQFPEKLIPLMIHNAVHLKPLPVYGKGENIRDWLWVEDHCSAIDLIFHKGTPGETYCIGGHNEWKNLDLVKLLCRLVDQGLSRADGTTEGLIWFVSDRPGHDMRYAIHAGKLERELGWKPSLTVEEGLQRTIRWYLEHQDWVEHITSGAYRSYYNQHYGSRLS